MLWLLQYYYKLGGLKQNTFSHGSGRQQSKTSFTELKSGVGRIIHVPSRGSKRESVSLSAFLGFWLHQSKPSFIITFSLESNLPLPLSHENTSDDFGPIQVVRDNLHVNNLNLIPLAKSLLSFNVTFTGSGH